MGHLSPLDGIGPMDIGLDRLEERLASETINEVILATNPTVEGEATANYIGQMCAQYGVAASRIAHGACRGSWKWLMEPHFHSLAAPTALKSSSFCAVALLSSCINPSHILVYAPRINAFDA